jgi:Heparinase II/III-like protein/Heparinase II/III N-terminus
VRGRAREARLSRRPLVVMPEELAVALGGLAPVAALRGPALAALPTVASFERELASQDGLVARADAVAAHRFDLLGSGARELGPEIDWHADVRTGRRWPLRHGSLLPPSYADGSDIRSPWELSRCQHLPLLAAAHRLTGDRRYVDELGAQLESWIDANPVELGPNWASTMEVAIRAANWVAALALCAEHARDEPWLERTMGSLLLHGRFVRAHPEDGPARGNHHVAGLAGLLVVAAVFSAGLEGQSWADWATGELEAELAHQVHPDGTDFEASIPYHRLVTELFVCGTQAAYALVPGSFDDEYRARLGRMLRFVADYTRADGLAPQIGDGDDGRFLPLGDYGALDPRDHRHLFRQADVSLEAQGNGAYPDGGYFVLRAGDLFAIVRCGDTGRGGLGGHGHNDQLSFELALGAQQLVLDPGTYAYTSDPAARNEFRSTAFHATLAVDGAEQNELRGDDLFLMRDRTRAEALDSAATFFEGRHHGFEALDPPATHTRRLELDAQNLTIRDTVESAATHELQWTFPLAECEVEVGPEGAVARFERATLEVEAPGLAFRTVDGWCSPRYGVRQPTPFLRATKRSHPGRDETSIVMRVLER